MSRAGTEPADGFLDREFASFRQARLRARRAQEEAALEPRRKAADPASTGSASIEAMLDGLDPDAGAQDATRAGERPEAAELPKINKVSALSPLAFPEPTPEDETRVHARAELPTESCSDPEFEKFRAARRPDSAAHRKPEKPAGRAAEKPAERPAEAAAPAEPAAAHVDDSCSDPEFEKFRAARMTGRLGARGERPPSSDKNPRPGAAERPPSDRNPRQAERPPSSDRNPRPAAPADDVDGSCSDPEFEKFRAARRPDSARFRKPEKPERPDGAAAAAEPAAPRVDDSCSDPAFERFRAARQGRAEAARPRKAEAEADPAATLAGAEQPAAEAPQDDDGALFFGTSVLERAKVRARVLESRSDVSDIGGEAPEPDAGEPDGAPSDPAATADQGERRRPPPPPLPRRP